jgi:hypothetical protein
MTAHVPLIKDGRLVYLGTIQRRYRVDRRDLWFIQAIFEAYDGVATVSTVNPKKGVVELGIAPGCETEVGEILEDLRLNGILIEDCHGKAENQ